MSSHHHHPYLDTDVLLDGWTIVQLLHMNLQLQRNTSGSNISKYLINELKRQFQQKRGMPVVTVLEKLLLDSANGKSTIGSGELPEELQLYKNDIDLAKLKLQLLMLPDLIQTRNAKCPNTPCKGDECPYNL